MKEQFDANRRIIALQALEQAPKYELSTQMLQRVLDHFAHAMSATAVDGLADWLSERGLVTVRDLGQGVRVVRLTQMGVDVAQGRTRVSGVDRPPPL